MNVMRFAVASSRPSRASHGMVFSPASFAATRRRCPAISVRLPLGSIMHTTGCIIPSVLMLAARSATLSGVILPRGFHAATCTLPTSTSMRRRTYSAALGGFKFPPSAGVIFFFAFIVDLSFLPLPAPTVGTANGYFRFHDQSMNLTSFPFVSFCQTVATQLHGSWRSRTIIICCCVIIMVSLPFC